MMHKTIRPKCVNCQSNNRRRDGLCRRCYFAEHGEMLKLPSDRCVDYEALDEANALRDTVDVGPCVARPGSVEKLAVLMARADCRVGLFDEGDREPDEPERTVFDEATSDWELEEVG